MSETGMQPGGDAMVDMMKRLGLWDESQEKLKSFVDGVSSKHEYAQMESSLIADFVFYMSLIFFRDLIRSASDPKKAFNEIMLAWRERVSYGFERQFEPYRQMKEMAKEDPEIEKYMKTLDQKSKAVREMYATSIRRVADDIERLIFAEIDKEKEDGEIV
ncbi:MAG: hypothetical protein GF334_08520 [Candidatus Altiarchaeales archaeon]|nr:hypothetical protein [Candidatus Altiarchaeales archaeon]